ncbi:hypothetical protein GCM10009828_076480 [Actinoplanes couchii]|uniref:Uncharacterized protein n=2 Tax=Actinoplanes couchii TaxID=403638 RepID=A0ABQ3WZK7_9ACTN|nr:hypothetical protein Aco03nite_000480 [Actinoplanes couchii]
MAALSVTAFDVARSTAAADFDSSWESAAGWVWLAAFIVQALLTFLIAFAWIGRRDPARARLVRAGVRAAGGVLLVTLIVIAVIVAIGLNHDAFRGSTIAFCVLFGLTTATGTGSSAFTALALSERTRA